MSQRAFAFEVGLHPTYVSQLETGAEPVGKVAALRIASRFRTEMVQVGITVEDLMRGTRARPEPPGKTGSRGGSDAARHDEAVA